MLNPYSEASMLIDNLQQHTDDRMRKTVGVVEELGDRDAVINFIQHQVSSIAGLAIAAVGQKAACEIMAVGLFAVEGYSEAPRC